MEPGSVVRQAKTLSRKRAPGQSPASVGVGPESKTVSVTIQGLRRLKSDRGGPAAARSISAHNGPVAQPVRAFL